MADITGTLHHSFDGKDYRLRLTWGVLADLQDEYGDDFLSRLEPAEGKAPPLRLMIGIVAKALVKGERMAPAEAEDLADDMLTSDPDIVPRLMQGAFPAAVGNGGQAAKRKR